MGSPEDGSPEQERLVNPAAVGKVYRGREGVARPERIEAYARATNDPNPRYLAEAGDAQIASPLFPVTYLMGMLDEAIADDELGMDFSRAVHGEQEIHFHAPLHAGDALRPWGEVAGIVEKSTGWLVDLALRLTRGEEVVVAMRCVIFLRKSRRGRQERGARGDEGPPPEPLYTFRFCVDPDQSERYAEASGDQNPIHLDAEHARAVGLPDRILHGFCTMAMITRVLVDRSLGGDPAALRSVSLRFSRPVLMGDELAVTVCELGRQGGRVKLGFEVENQRGKRVVTSGRAEVSAEAAPAA